LGGAASETFPGAPQHHWIVVDPDHAVAAALELEEAVAGAAGDVGDPFGPNWPRRSAANW
jgi:hypothetical protein